MLKMLILELGNAIAVDKITAIDLSYKKNDSGKKIALFDIYVLGNSKPHVTVREDLAPKSFKSVQNYIHSNQYFSPEDRNAN